MEGICDFALQLPGPSHKTGYDHEYKAHDKTGVTIHTAEYDVAQWDERVLYNALFSGREASWHFTITKEGWLFQHYPVDATCWHCGYWGNLWTVGIECEGYAPNKISGPQYDLLVKLLKWLYTQLYWAKAPWHRAGTQCSPDCKRAIWEHAQWMATLCQVFSRGMIDAEQLMRDLKEEPMPDKTEWQRYTELLAQELGHFHDVEEWAENLRHLALLLQATWRRGDSEPALDDPIWLETSVVCDQMMQAVERLKGRCSWLGRPG